MDLNQYARAIASIESAGSGDYQAVGPRTGKGNRAYGRYQVMDFNIGPWTEKYLGQRLTPEQFLSNPEAQDAVFQGEFGSYIDRFGNPQDAASAWFTGRPLSEGAGRSDILGTTGAGYVQKFNAALGQPQGGNMQPQGLLGTMSTRNAPQPEEQRTPFFKNPDFWDTLAIGLQGMTLNPNQALIGAVQERMGQRREQAQTTAQQNRTLDYLRSLGTPQAQEAIRYAEGTGDITGALRMATAQPEQTALMQNVQWLMSQGVPMNEALQTARSGSVVNVDTKSASKFEEEFAKGDAKTIGEVYATGLQAARNISRIDQLETLLSTAPSGAEGAIKLAAGEFGINTEGLSDIQAAQAIINSLVPEQRQPGSGPMSDADLALFKQSLPRIINQPGGNQLIIQAMRGIAQYDAEGAAIVQRLRSGEIDRATAFELLQSRQNPLANFRGAAGTGTGGGGNQPVVIDGVTIRKVN